MNTMKDMEEDYYKILGVKRDASQKEIQRAYRELARKFHPGHEPGGQEGQGEVPARAAGL